MRYRRVHVARDAPRQGRSGNRLVVLWLPDLRDAGRCATILAPFQGKVVQTHQIHAAQARLSILIAWSCRYLRKVAPPRSNQAIRFIGCRGDNEPSLVRCSRLEPALSEEDRTSLQASTRRPRWREALQFRIHRDANESRLRPEFTTRPNRRIGLIWYSKRLDGRKGTWMSHNPSRAKARSEWHELDKFRIDVYSKSEIIRWKHFTRCRKVGWE